MSTTYIVIVVGHEKQAHSTRKPLHFEATGANVNLDFGDGHICNLTNDDPAANWRLVKPGHPDYLPPYTRSGGEWEVITIDPATTTEASFYGYHKPCAHSTIVGTSNVKVVNTATNVLTGNHSK